MNNPIKKLFQLVFINTKYTYNNQIETAYFSVKIYSNICYRYGEEEDII